MEKQMKLSNETLTVLKNFSAINQGIQFKKWRDTMANEEINFFD